MNLEHLKMSIQLFCYIKWQTQGFVGDFLFGDDDNVNNNK